jgi:CHASE3 domain sensor protein
MWDDLIFLKVVAAVSGGSVVVMSTFFYFSVKKIREIYNDLIDEAEHKVSKLEKSITTLVDLLLIYQNWVGVGNPSCKLEFQATLDELPQEIRKLVKIKL